MNNSAFFALPDETIQPSDGFLAGLHDDEVAAILSFMQARRYIHEEVAIHQGDAERSLFVVTTGRFEVLVPTLQGPRRMRLAQAGDIFGELAFFDGQSRSAEVRYPLNNLGCQVDMSARLLPHRAISWQRELHNVGQHRCE